MSSTMPSESEPRFSTVFKTFPTFPPETPHLDPAVPLIMPQEGLHHTVVLRRAAGPLRLGILTLV